MKTRLRPPCFLLLSAVFMSDASFSLEAKHYHPAIPLTVIGYHEITDRQSALIPDYSVTTQQFQQHISWLKNNGFHFINVDQLIKAHEGNIVCRANRFY